MIRLPTGLYELLVTEELASLLPSLTDGLEVTEGPVDPDAAPQVLARFLHDVLLRAFRSLRGEDRLEVRVALANDVLGALLRQAPASGLLPSDAVSMPARQLLSVVDASPAGLAPAAPPPRPRIPLRSSDLLVNGPRDLRIGAEIQRELCSADRVDLLVSFLKWSGVRVLDEALSAFARRRPGHLRVLTTAYLGATDPEALEHLRSLGAEIRVSYDSRRTRLHAKAWLFHRESGFSTAFVGSSNLSAPAILDGLEWNVRLSEVDNHAILAKFRSAFEQYWGEGEFIDYDAEAFREAVGKERDESALIASIRIRPFAHQQQILDALETERARQHCRNLVVAATGTGKTIIAALDYRRLVEEHGDLPLLFVAHRREILEQARHMFRVVLQDGSFGELLVAGRRPRDGRHVFAAIQSLHGHRLASVAADAYQMVIVDEFHHAAAPTYERLLSHLRPRYLLGLTATPERADGQSVLAWFDDRIAAELRLWTALDRGLLVPFQYFGVSDGTDLSRLAWRRGGYAGDELENVYTGDDVRVGIVLRTLRDKVRSVARMKALAFCVGVRHAEFMARRFRDAGIRAEAVHGETPSEARDAALRALRKGDVNVLFTVDLFNEGVDVPDVDTVLFLRPTESATVFLQQLGRGLRHADGKPCLTVLDFIGNAHRQFRFDARYRAILGGTRRRVADAIEEGFPHLPPGCSMHLDRQAQEVVLGNVRRALDLGWRGLVDDLRSLGDVDLATFLERAGVDLGELYRGGRCWSDLRRAARLPTPSEGPDEAPLARALARLIHLDDPDRLDAWRIWLSEGTPPHVAPEGTWEHRLQRMLFVGLGHVRRPLAELPQALDELWRHPAIRSELTELLDILDNRLRRPTRTLDGLAGVPIRSHATYSLDEIMAGFGVERSGHIYRPRGQGVWYEPSAGADLLFITLEKTEQEYSPTTLYEDYPMSPTEFHWESQNSTSPVSPVGRRYIDGSSHVLLFARLRRRDDRGITMPYVLLGRARYLRHESERPMRIVWRLDHPMPPDWFSEVKLAAG
jgi:superfamily II DNA or RNA helicase/HKD family nuclease